MEIIIAQQAKETEKEYFNNQWLTIKPFKSNIIGLSLCLQNANGLGKRVPMAVTDEILVKENISTFGYFWFEYLSADKEYVITVNLD